MTALPFQSIDAHGFVRVAVGIPAVRVADPPFVARTIRLALRASDEDAAVVLFPELGLSAYSNGLRRDADTREAPEPSRLPATLRSIASRSALCR